MGLSDLFYHNEGGGKFREVSADVGIRDSDRAYGLGVTWVDFDNDGRLDLVQTNADQPLLLYHNITEKPGNWIELKLIGTKSNRDAIGAWC